MTAALRRGRESDGRLTFGSATHFRSLAFTDRSVNAGEAMTGGEFPWRRGCFILHNIRTSFSNTFSSR